MGCSAGSESQTLTSQAKAYLDWVALKELKIDYHEMDMWCMVAVPTG